MLELLERARIAARRLRGFGNHVDLLRQRAHRVLEADEAFGGREAAQRVADLGKLLFEHGEGGTLRARLPAVADALGQRPDLGFQRFDRAARHRLGQRAADFGEVFAERGDRAFVGLMQRRDLRVEFVKLLLDAREIVRRVPGRGLRRGGGERRSGLRSATVERALPRGNLLGPACRSALARRRLLRRHGRECRLSRRRAARSAPAGVRTAAPRCVPRRSPDRACGRAAPARRRHDRRRADREHVRSRAAAARAQAQRREPVQARSLARSQPEPSAQAAASGRRDGRERKRGLHPRRPPDPDMLVAVAARLPSIVRWIRRNRSALGTGARIRTGGDWRGPRNPALTLVYQGKQAVNLLSKQTDFLPNTIYGSV